MKSGDFKVADSAIRVDHHPDKTLIQMYEDDSVQGALRKKVEEEMQRRKLI